MAETQQVALYGIVKPIDKQADSKQKDSALYHTTQHWCRGREVVLRQRQIARDAYDEEEEGEHKVARRHAVPLGMAEHLERIAIAVVHQNHARHG